MIQLAGWDGPECIGDSLYRYSKTISWIRLYIVVKSSKEALEFSEFYGGVTGAREDFEVAADSGRWMRFRTDMAYTPDGNLILRLRDYITLGTVIRRTGDGMEIAEQIDSIEDMVAYLERCTADLSP